MEKVKYEQKITEPKKLKYGYNKSELKKFTHHAWRYLILFSLLYCAHYCTRLNLGNAQVAMTEFSSDQIGIITSVLFWSYGIGHLINGRLGEIVGVRRFIILSVVLSAAANVVMGFQSSILIMSIVWGFNGFFQSMAWSPGVSSLNFWWPADKRGFATGFANAFSGFGQVLATLMVALSFAVLPNFGWRSAFWLPAVVPLIVVVFYVLFTRSGPRDIGLRDYEDDNKDRAAEEEEMGRIVKEKGVLYPYLYLLKNKTFIACMLVVFGSGIARYGLVTWIPKFLNEEANLGPVVSLLTSTILPIGMGIGTFVVPVLTDKFCPDNRLLAGVVSGIGAALCILGFVFLEPTGVQFYVMMALLFLAGFFIYAINGIIWAFAADVGGRVFASTATGILDFSAYMGAAIQAYIYGAILTRGNWDFVFLSVALFCLIVAVVSFFNSRKKK